MNYNKLVEVCLRLHYQSKRFRILGDYPAIDFEKKLYSDAMTILEEHVNPRPVLPGVILEQVGAVRTVYVFTY